MVTAAGRHEFLNRSLRCYSDQTYPNRELVIVSDGPLDYQQTIANLVVGRSDIRCVWVNGSRTLGSLRNISVGCSSGELLCQWDDDDFCLPERLAFQVKHLLARPRIRACFLGEQLHYYFGTSEVYLDNWSHSSGGEKLFSLIPGTLLAYRDVVHYESKSRGEDSILAEEIMSKDSSTVLVLKGHPWMHIYSHHGTNQVYDLDHHLEISKLRCEPRQTVLRFRRRLSQALDYLALAPQVRVMSKNGLVFIHRLSCYDRSLPLV